MIYSSQNPQLSLSDLPQIPDLHAKMKSNGPLVVQKMPRIINTQNKTNEQILLLARLILKKGHQTRTQRDNQFLLTLVDNNAFLMDLVTNVGVQTYKQLLKHARVKQLKERQLLCEEGKPITHLFVVLEGKLGIGKKIVSTKEVIAKYLIFTNQQAKLKQNQAPTPPTIHHAPQNPDKDSINQITSISCRQIQNVRKKMAYPKRKATMISSAGLMLPLPSSLQTYSQYNFQSFVSTGQEYGATQKYKSKYHMNTLFAVENSFIIYFDFNHVIYWFQHAFRAKLAETIGKMKQLHAFKWMDQAKLSDCILAMRKHKKRRNDYLYKQGDMTQSLFILTKGQIKMTKQANLFQQNPNQLYMDRRKLMNKSSNLSSQNQKNIQALPYANLTTLYNYRPMKKIIQMGIITSNTNNNYNMIGQEEIIEKRVRQTNAIVLTDAQYYSIQIGKLEEILGAKLTQEFYNRIIKNIKNVILYRQNQYADRINWENRMNLDYFYVDQNIKEKSQPRKYKIQKINNQMTQKSSKQTPQDNQAKIQPFYNTFNFHKLVKTQRKSQPSARGKSKSSISRRQSEQSSQNIKVKFSPLQERLMGISHSWKPIKKKVGQEIKVMEKISMKRHSINLYQPLIDQDYFRHVDKEQRRITREHKIFKLSLGKMPKPKLYV